MVDVAIISKNRHIQRSLYLLMNTDPDVKIIHKIDGNNVTLTKLNHSKRLVVVLDIEVENWLELLNQYSTKHCFILYSHSRDFLEISHYIERYKVKFFNVYTKPECILHTIKEFSY